MLYVRTCVCQLHICCSLDSCTHISIIVSVVCRSEQAEEEDNHHARSPRQWQVHTRKVCDSSCTGLHTYIHTWHVWCIVHTYLCVCLCVWHSLQGFEGENWSHLLNRRFLLSKWTVSEHTYSTATPSLSCSSKTCTEWSD